MLGDLKAQAADRLGKIPESAEKRRVVGAEEGASAKCGPIRRAPSKKVSKIRTDLVAPTGIESESDDDAG